VHSKILFSDISLQMWLTSKHEGKVCLTRIRNTLAQIVTQRYKKLSCGRDSTHLTLLYRAFRYVEPFKGVCINYPQR